MMGHPKGRWGCKGCLDCRAPTVDTKDHDLSIVKYNDLRGLGYFGPCGIFSIHRSRESAGEIHRNSKVLCRS